MKAGPNSERWILIAEDNDGDATLIRHALKDHDVTCKVVVVKDGARAAEIVAQSNSGHGQAPALVLLDLNLPKQSGLDVLKLIRQSLFWKDVVVIVFSSSEARVDREKSLELGADQYIVKPSQLDEFLMIGQVLKNAMTATRSTK